MQAICILSCVVGNPHFYTTIAIFVAIITIAIIA